MQKVTGVAPNKDAPTDHPKVIPKWFEMIQRWFQNYSKILTKWLRTGSKTKKKVAQLVTKWFPNDSKMLTKWLRNGSKIKDE